MGRRGHNEGTIRHRPDGLWEARLSLANGKRKSVYGKTRKAVQDKLRAAQRDLDAGLDLGTAKQTVGAFLDRWLVDVAKPTVRPKTYASYAQLVRLHLKPALGHHQLAKLSPQHVQAMMNAKSAAGLSPRTVQYLRAILRRALGQALKWGLVSRNVATLVDPPRSQRQDVTPLSPLQARAFLTAAEGDRLEALYSVAIALGLRQGEALGLRWDDVDLDAGMLKVRHALQRIDGTLQLVEPKTKRSKRTIPMPPTIVTALREHRVRQLEERLIAGPRWQEHNLVFPSTIGTPADARNIVRRFHAILDQAGLPSMRFHDLRHTCASLLLAQHVPPRVVMETLGHSQIALTMDTYSHVMPVMQREAANLMDQLLTDRG
jgi:integrase